MSRNLENESLNSHGIENSASTYALALCRAGCRREHAFGFRLLRFPGILHLGIEPSLCTALSRCGDNHQLRRQPRAAGTSRTVIESRHHHRPHGSRQVSPWPQPLAVVARRCSLFPTKVWTPESAQARQNRVCHPASTETAAPAATGADHNLGQREHWHGKGSSRGRRVT